MPSSKKRNLIKERIARILHRSEFWVSVYIFIFLILGVATLPHYGLTFDEGLGNIFFGERYIRYFVSGNWEYLDFNNRHLSIHQRPLNLFLSPYRQLAHEFPPIADTLSALMMEVFAYRLKWMDPIDSFHLLKVLLSGLLLWFLFRFASDNLGNFAAIIAIFVMSTYPRYWGDMHFNPKDIPITIFFTFVVIAYIAWYEKPSWPGALVVGILEGLALSIKANALFIPIVIVLGIWPWQLQWPPWKRVIEHSQNQVGKYILMIFTSITVHIASWPFLYDDPIVRLKLYYGFVISRGNRGGSGSWDFDPLIQTITTMPELVLFLLLVGIGFAIYSIYKTRTPIFRLLLVWLILPIFRTSLPNAVNFDGIRHFEEFLPAASLLVGYGGSSIVHKITKNRCTKKPVFSIALLVLILGSNVVVNLRYHPYEYIYYNSLVGGLYGAHNKYGFPEATDYWASSYQQGMDWLNENVEPNARLHVPIAEWIVQLTAPIRLREDIKLISEELIPRTLRSGLSVYVMFINRKSFYTPLAIYCSQNLSPIHQIIVDGVPILEIYRLKNIESIQNRVIPME